MMATASSRIEAKPAAYSIGRRVGIAAVALALVVFSTGNLIRTVPPPAVAEKIALPPKAILEMAKLTAADEPGEGRSAISAERENELIPLSGLPLERVAPFRAISSTSRDFPTALKCLSQAIYYEAANESRAGKLGVAQVVLNRVRHPAYPHSICGVVYDGWNEPICQFSFTCDGSLLRPAAGPRWTESEAVARAALAGETSVAVGSATNYHADYVVPRWAYTLSKVRQIDTHIFYRLPDRWGSAAVFSARWAGGERIPQIDRTALLALLEANAEEEMAPVIEMRGHVPADVADRHADGDIGGRLDPAKEWRLSIPDPVAASSSYTAAFASQGGVGPGPARGAGQ